MTSAEAAKIRDEDKLKSAVAQAVSAHIAKAMLIEGIKYPRWPGEK